MRAINTTTLQLEDIDPMDGKIRYAILSHTWGKGEVLFDDIRNLGPGQLAVRVQKTGAEKVIRSCAQAKTDGYHYLWIDTCCIDKSSSAELSEAINSMFKWYALADVCYAYLADVTAAEFLEQDPPRDIHWFMRGWTLQELIAPLRLVFFDKAWAKIGTRDEFSSRITSITSIGKDLLNRPSCTPRQNINSLTRQLGAFTVSTRMSWASERETTRPEDLAYCLMGLFDVNMPLLYGEGGVKAFIRLQSEVIASGSDQSILAWTPGDGRLDVDWSWWGREHILAPTPRVRFLVGVKESLTSQGPRNLSLHGNQIQATVFLAKLPFGITGYDFETYAAVLQFQGDNADGFPERLALHLERFTAASGDTVYRKVDNYPLRLVMGHSGKLTAAAIGRRGNTDLEPVELDHTDFKRTSITILAYADVNGSRAGTFPGIMALFTPRLSLTMGTNLDAYSYRVQASTTEWAQKYSQPQSLPLNVWKWLSPCQTIATIRTGILCFLPTDNTLSASKCGFLVVWAVQLPRAHKWVDDGERPSLINDRGDNIMNGHSWWHDGTPLLCILPCSALPDVLSSEFEALSRGTSHDENLRFFQRRFATIDGLFGEDQDYDCTCWVTGDYSRHFWPSPYTSETDYGRREQCWARLTSDAEDAAERWVPRMVPKQEVTVEGVVVTASIRKLQFLELASCSLEIETRRAD